MAIGVALAVASIIQAGIAHSGSREAASEQRALGRLNAQLIGEETAVAVEEARRDIVGTIGRNRAAMGGTGVALDTGTSRSYLQTMTARGEERIDWIERRGKLQQERALRGAAIQADSTKAMGTQAALRGITQAIGHAGQAARSAGWDWSN